jgi:isopentenyldiphosphate isomerase
MTNQPISHAKHAEEVWQGYAETGEKTSVPITQAAAAEGSLHGASHVWVWRIRDQKLEILLQKRAPGKRTWPGYWDISAAGHIDFGETPLQAAVREAKEELNIDLDTEDMRLAYVHRAYLVSENEPVTVENEFQFVYLTQARADWIVALRDGEASEVRWFTIEAFADMVQRSDGHEKLVPHGDVYYASLFHAIDVSVDG